MDNDQSPAATQSQGVQPPPSTPPPTAAGAPADDDNWGAAAQPDLPTQANPQNSQQVQQQSAGDLAPQARPIVLTPQKRGGILGLVDDMADVLAGKTRPEMATDQDGNPYVKNTSLTHGEQWERIGASLVHGAAAGWAAGKGAGNMGKAALAGVETGMADRKAPDDEARQMTADAQKQMLANANYQQLRMNMADQAWQAGQRKVKAQQDTVKYYQDQVDRMVKPISEGGAGGTVLGVAAHPGDIDDILKVNPDVMKDMIQKHQIEIVPHFSADGTNDGITVVKMPDGYRTTMLPAGTEFNVFDQTKNQIVPHKSGSPILQGEVDDYNTAAGSQALKFTNDQLKQQQTQAETAQANANANKANQEATAVPSEIAKNKGQTAEAFANASKANAEAKKAVDAASDDELVDEVGSGKMPVERLSYLLARKPELLQQVALKYPGFDGSKVAAYINAMKDFTSTKPGSAGGALNAGGTALGHLQELSNMNTVKSHIPGTADYNAYMNKADSLAVELAKFYGDATIPAIAAIKSTLTATLPGNRQAAIKTQAQSMGRKFDSYEQSWQNAAPSANYEAPMPGIAKSAMEARAALDPEYRQRAVQQQSGQRPAAPPNASQPPALPPNTPPPAAGMKRVWAPGMAAWKDIPANQVKNIPGQVVQ